MTYEPYLIEGATRTGRWLVTCDHAANTVPEFVANGDLGLPAEDMQRHIAWDVGAMGVSRHLSAILNGPVIGSNFSRLVIDPNRGEDDPTLVMQLYDGTIIPANRHISPEATEERLDRCYRPYHTELARLAARPRCVIVSVHSFTPRLRGRELRPWEIGILYASDDRLARPLIDLLRAEGDLTVGDNQPYNGALRGDAMDRHALSHGRPHVLIELRNDLIADDKGQAYWAKRTAPLLIKALEMTGL